MERFFAERSHVSRMALLESFIPLARMLAENIRKKFPWIAEKFEFDDLVSIAIIEINSAIDKYDPKIGNSAHASFRTYVVARLGGGFKGTHGILIKRIYKESGQSTARIAIENIKYGNSDSKEKHSLRLAQALNFCNSASLDQKISENAFNEDIPLLAFVSANDTLLEEQCEQSIMLAQIAKALAYLPKSVRTVITLSLCGYSVAEIVEYTHRNARQIYNAKNRGIASLQAILNIQTDEDYEIDKEQYTYPVIELPRSVRRFWKAYDKTCSNNAKRILLANLLVEIGCLLPSMFTQREIDILVSFYCERQSGKAVSHKFGSTVSLMDTEKSKLIVRLRAFTCTNDVRLS